MVKAATVLALLSAVLMCCTVSYSVVTVNKHVSMTLMKLDTEIDEMHRLTLEVALTAAEARKASVKESQYLDIWNSEISKSITSINSVSVATVSTLQATQQTVASLQLPIKSADQALMAATASISAFQPVLTQSTSVLKQSTEDLATLNALLSDPHIPQTIAHTDATLDHLDSTTKDVQEEVHKFTHPGIWARIKGAVLDVAHVFNPL